MTRQERIDRDYTEWVAILAQLRYVGLSDVEAFAKCGNVLWDVFWSEVAGSLWK